MWLERGNSNDCSFWLDTMQMMILFKAFLQISLGRFTVPFPPQIRGHLWVPLWLYWSVRWTAICLTLHGQILCWDRAHVPLLFKHHDRGVQKWCRDRQHRVLCSVQRRSARQKGERQVSWYVPRREVRSNLCPFPLWEDMLPKSWVTSTLTLTAPSWPLTLLCHSLSFSTTKKSWLKKQMAESRILHWLCVSMGDPKEGLSFPKEGKMQ